MGSGESVPDFGLTASDYSEHRAGFPAELAERLIALGAVRPGERAVDVGTGTGHLARLLAPHVGSVLGIDPSEALIAAARSHPGNPGNLDFEIGVAEETGLAADSVDLLSAGQCWHWFDAECAAREALRVLRPGGRLVIAHFDWIPLPANVVEATERLILRYSPDWAFAGGTGVYPPWLTDVAAAGFTEIETFSFDLAVPYSHEAWVGRVRASAGVGASLPEAQVERFSTELAELLAREFPGDPLAVGHRTWALLATKPR